MGSENPNRPPQSCLGLIIGSSEPCCSSIQRTQSNLQTPAYYREYETSVQLLARAALKLSQCGEERSIEPNPVHNSAVQPVQGSCVTHTLTHNLLTPPGSISLNTYITPLHGAAIVRLLSPARTRSCWELRTEPASSTT